MGEALIKVVDWLAKGFGSGPVPFFLALALVTVVLLYRGARKRERELTDELVKQERAFRAEIAAVKQLHFDQMTVLITTTHGVLELKRELEKKAARKGAANAGRQAGGAPPTNVGTPEP